MSKLSLGILIISLLVALVASDDADRDLRLFDIFDPSTDLCLNGEEADGYPIYGPCDTALFPVCSQDELICYNRRPMRNRFYLDNRQPYFFIEYRSVFCYPSSWGGCSSCTPGRYCRSESRCILDDVGYPCEQWL